MSACIRAHGLTLDVPIFLQREREVKGWTGMCMGTAFDPPKRSVVRLLEDIDLDIGEGDRLAILGRNGAGKSTLLRVLNRVYQPTSGRLEVEGSCQALLNMSLGFSGEATVGENIYLRGVAMGLKSSFLRDQVEPILEFAGLRHKVGHRLRTLSSGQQLRLGFAISTSVQHDIMLMDEWIGAGDADFMAKAKERMRSRVGGSKIVVLASHSTGLLRDICNKAIVLERGKLAYQGEIADALGYYHELMAKLRAGEEMSIEQSAQSAGRHVFGAIEDVRGTDVPARYLLKGWMVDSEGATPSAIVVEWGGARYVANMVKRIRRPDVMRHFGLTDADCGFLSEVDVPDAPTLAAFAYGGFRVMGGDMPERADAPLRISATVGKALAELLPREVGQ
jgi:lipopolysaccharide transport system ATP-binding protein